MKIKLLYLLALIAIFSVSCKKNRDDFRGNSYIRGRVFLLDTINKSNVSQPIGNKTVSVGYLKDSGRNFIYSVTADSSGYFVFQNLKVGDYVIFCNDSEKGSYYYAQLYITAQNFTTYADSAVLTLTPLGYNSSGFSQNALVVTALDSATGYPLYNANIFIYNSVAAAFADTGYHGTGSIATLTTGVNGMAQKSQLPANRELYIKAAYTLNGLVYSNYIDSVNLDPRQISPLLTLKLFAVPGILFTVADKADIPLYNAKVYIYTSEAIARADTGLTGNGAIATASTGSNGQAVKYQLPYGQHLFIRGAYNIGGITFSQLDTTTITLQDTLRHLLIKLDSAFTTVTFHSTDGGTGVIAGDSIWVYGSNIIAQADTGNTGAGALYKLVADINGNAYINKPSVNDLFVRAFLRLASIKLSINPKVMHATLIPGMNNPIGLPLQ